MLLRTLPFLTPSRKRASSSSVWMTLLAPHCFSIGPPSGPMRALGDKIGSTIIAQVFLSFLKWRTSLPMFLLLLGMAPTSSWASSQVFFQFYIHLLEDIADGHITVPDEIYAKANVTTVEDVYSWTTRKSPRPSTIATKLDIPVWSKPLKVVVARVFVRSHASRTLRLVSEPYSLLPSLYS